MKASANKIALQRYVFGQKAVMPRTLQCNQFYRLKKSQKLKLLYSQEKKKKTKNETLLRYSSIQISVPNFDLGAFWSNPTKVHYP